MDPNLMKFLEEDEDETMHSGADVEAFTAELNRDIEGNSSLSQQQSSDSESAVLLHESSQTTSQFLQQWQNSGHVGIVNFQSGEDHIVMEQHGPDPLNRKEEDGSSHTSNGLPFTHNQSLDSCPDPQDYQNAFSVSQNDTSMSEKQLALNQKPDPYPEREPHMHKLQTMSNQQSMTMGLSSQEAMTSGSMTSTNQQAAASMKIQKQVPFGMLLPLIQPQLDKDRAMQLQILYAKLKKNELSKDGFMRHMRSIVGEQMLKMAAYKLQTRLQSQHQTSLRQMQVSSDLTNTTSNSSTVVSQQVENKVDPHNMQTSFPTHGGAASSYSPFPTNNVASLTSFQPQFQDSQMRQAPAHQNMNTSHLGPTIRPKSITNMNMQAGLGTLTHVNSNSTQQQNQVQWPSSASKEQTLGVSSSMNYVKQEPVDQSNEMHSSRTGFTPPMSMANTQMRSITYPSGNLKASLKKPVVGQKKPMEAPGSSPPSSKKQKVSGAFLDQSIEQLNDVTAVSGVNLREEEEQLFSGSKEDSRVTEASRKVVQEEEERLILHKLPLQKKVVEIMAKSGLKSMSNDVERCLSLCVEERMRGLISNLIRLSKQRVDMEKPRHRTIITSDIRQQIMTINRKAREECEKNQAETAKSQNPVENEDSAGVDGEKDEGRAKATKVNKEEDDKMRTTAANVAVRAATGVGDMLSRWQLMIANQNKGGTDTSSSSQPGKDVARKPLPTSRKTKDSRETEKRDSSAGSVRKVGRNQVVPRIARSISVKDVIAILEREPQMSKSTLIYRLYDKVRADVAPE